MSTQETVLNNMLELCEKQMSEGDYLIAASLLKTVNELKAKTEFRTLAFDSPINIKAGKLNLIIDSIVQKLVTNPYTSYYQTVSINVQFTDEMFSIKKVSFEIWLTFIIQKEMAIDVKLSDNLSPNSNITYEKYKKFIIKRDQLDDENEEWMYGSYSNYIASLAMQIIELKTRIIV
jgi:hypothetical protein